MLDLKGQSAGVCGVMVGLLLPAVQRIDTRSSSQRARLKDLLTPDGVRGVTTNPSLTLESIVWD